jgi:type IV pilus assembly protein PilM
MALPFLSPRSIKRRDHLFSIDLGGRNTKATCLEQRVSSYALSAFAIMDAPIFDKSWSVDLLSDHLKAVVQALKPKTKQVIVAIDVNEVVVRTVEMPLMPVFEMRQILKINSKSYLQQELPGYVFDCYVVPQRTNFANSEKSKNQTSNGKAKVLIAGAKKAFVDDLNAAITNAGLIPDFVVPSLIGPVNAFERAMPETCNKDVIALVDVGFKNTTICLLQEGELILTRVVNIGGDKITNGLAEAMNITYAEAEGIKIGMPSEVQSQLEILVSPLGRELRASIDFFEHQQDRTVAQVYVSGGSARSETIVQTLHTELGIECKTWNPTTFLQMALSSQQANEVEHIAPQLTVAIGAAVTAV